jgi:2-dehydropantoate 2-reductase
MASETIYILGSGVVGFPLAAYLTQAGRKVIAVRTSRQDVPHGFVTVTVQNGAEQFSVPVETSSLAQLSRLDGLLVVTAKSYVNQALALELQAKATGPVVLLQNGLSVEKPFLAANFASIYRCVLYVTSQTTAENTFAFRPVAASPVGVIHGAEADLAQCVAVLTTAGFPFRSEANITREVWKKAIINAVFNSICPLLDVDNGIFARHAAVANLAREIIQECVTLTDRLGLGLTESEMVEQILMISQRSDGQLISTLQDIQVGRPTEIEFLNLEIARIAAGLQPTLSLPKTELLGKMILAKSLQRS